MMSGICSSTGRCCASPIPKRCVPVWRNATHQRPPTGCWRRCAASSKPLTISDRLKSTDFQRAHQVKNIKNDTLPAGRDLKVGELRALVDACKADDSPAGMRDAALLGVLYICGLRRAELVGLDLADFDPESGKLTIHRGKGRKDRNVYVTGGAAARSSCGWFSGVIRREPCSHRSTKADRFNSGG